MKTVLILRHGKSSWNNPGLEDHDRPLKKRGRKDAPRIGRLLVREGLVPDRIISSTAARARRTAELAAEACGYEGEVALSPEIYLSGPDAYLEELRILPDDVDRAMVVGHNPDVEDLVFLLSGRSEVMPTAALAAIDVPLDRWKDLREDRRGTMRGVWRPRELSEE
jgi:phosphohistidine phosphatase